MSVELKQEVAVTLSRQISHPLSYKLLRLLKNSNVVYSDLEQCIKKLDNECETFIACKKKSQDVKYASSFVRKQSQGQP